MTLLLNIVIYRDNIKENSFDILRLLGAYMVLLSHSFRHFGVEKPSYMLFFTDGSIGVMMFFAITGFFMMPCWERAQNNNKPYLSFLWNRFIKLYPPIWISFIIISLLDFTLIGEAFDIKLYLKYIVDYNVFGQGQYGLNGLANGVLWTIIPDVIFYIVTPIVYRVMQKNGIIAFCIIVLFHQFNVHDFYVMEQFEKVPYIGSSMGLTLTLFYEFLIGSFMYFHLNSILKKVGSIKNMTIIVLSFSIIYYLYRNIDSIPKNYVMHSPVLGIIVPWITILLGFFMGTHKLKLDLSYGIFLYHMILVGILKIYGVEGIYGIVLVFIFAPLLSLFNVIIVENRVKSYKIYKSRYN